MEGNEIKDKLNIAKYKLNIKEHELAKIKVQTFAYNPKITELMLDIKNLKQEIKNLEELVDE